jgi:hypothetical protein
MPVLVKSDKLSVISAYLANLSGIVSIRDIVDTILQVSNLKSKTLDKLKSEAYDKHVHTVPLSSLYVDMSYQRRIRLQHILKKLSASNGFDIHGAGAIDVAVRPENKMFVWDGLRRSIMAGLCGLDSISASIYSHRYDEYTVNCQQIEARFFKMRNADSEKMKPEEIFKSKIAYRDPEAARILSVLYNCKLDVEGLNPGGKILNGFREFHNNLTRTKDPLEEKYLIESSRIIRAVYKKEQNVSVYLLTGLAWLMQVNDELPKSYSHEEILEAFVENKNAFPKQGSLTKNRLTSRGRESVAFLIAKSVLKDENGLLNKLGLDKGEMELLEESEI